MIIIAYALMIISHVGRFILHNQSYIIIGMPVIPIFAYMIAQGSRFTRNQSKYIYRIILIGVISEPFFRYMTGDTFNDIFCFSIALAFICCFREGESMVWKSFNMVCLLIMINAISFRLTYVMAWVFLFDCIYDYIKQPVRPLIKRSYLNYSIYPLHLVLISGIKYFL